MSADVRAIILAAGINGVGAARSLGRAGIPHVVLYTGERNPVRWSRYPVAVARITDSSDDDLLLELIARYAGAGRAILACSDAYADFLSRQRVALEDMGLAVICPPEGVGEALNDKSRELSLMLGVQVDLPRSLTSLPASVEQFVASVGLPAIIKPRSYAQARLIRTKNVIVRSEADVVAFLAEHAAHRDAFVAQEVIEGPDESLWVCNCLFGASGELLQAFTFQRIRTSPPHFGVTTFAVSRHNADIKAACARIGHSLRYVGPAMIEFKHDSRTDRYCYIETNPRIGMCNILETTSGVNNVAAAVRFALGDTDTAQPVGQRDGVHYLNVYGDLDSRIGDGESILDIARSYLTTLGAPRAWAYWSWHDPQPWIRVTVDHTRQAVMRITGWVHRRITR
jgi:predicted ATP-grasp superfamily ATP-dependent carboligase